MAKTPKVASTRLSLPLGVAGTEPDDPEGSLAYATDTGRVRVKQAGGWADVSGSGGPPTGPAGGDLAGTYPNPTVSQARGLKSATTTVSVSAATAPTSGQVLTATGSTAATWQTPSGSPTGAAGGDLASTYPNPEVAAIHETSGPTKLTIGSIATDQVLIRSGSTLIGQSGAAPTGSAGGDLSGTYPNPTVTQARGLVSATTTVSVSAATAPTSGQVLTATGSTAATWQTPSGSPTGSAGGDLSGTYPNPSVLTSAALKSATTHVVTSAATAPTSGQALVATSSTAATWQTLSSSLAIRDPFWDPPTSGSPDDDEFTVDTVASGVWTIRVNSGAATRDGAVDAGAAVMSSGHYRSTAIGSTLFIQSRPDESVQIHKTLAGALSTTQLWWFAFGTVANYSPTERVVTLSLAKNLAGQTDPNNRIIISAQNSATRVDNVTVFASVTTTETGGTSDAGPLGMDGLYARVSHGSNASGNFYGGLWKRNGLHSANVTGALLGPQFNLSTDRIAIAWAGTAFTGVPYNGSSSQNSLMALHFIRRMPNTGVWFAQS